VNFEEHGGRCLLIRFVVPSLLLKRGGWNRYVRVWREKVER